MEAFDVVRGFERALSEYTGAPYVVAVNSCTAALRLALRWVKLDTSIEVVECPSVTYPSVPMAVKWAGFQIQWTDEKWSGCYEICPTRVIDAAKRLKPGMYEPGEYQCVSFHPQKPLGLANGGGAILHDDTIADKWFRQMRFDGRTEGVATKDDVYLMIGEHVYMMPACAAEGLQRLAIYAKSEHEDQPMDDYPDLSGWRIFA